MFSVRVIFLQIVAKRAIKLACIFLSLPSPPPPAEEGVGIPFSGIYLFLFILLEKKIILQ